MYTQWSGTPRHAYPEAGETSTSSRRAKRAKTHNGKPGKNTQCTYESGAKQHTTDAHPTAVHTADRLTADHTADRHTANSNGDRHTADLHTAGRTPDLHTTDHLLGRRKAIVTLTGAIVAEAIVAEAIVAEATIAEAIVAGAIAAEAIVAGAVVAGAIVRRRRASGVAIAAAAAVGPAQRTGGKRSTRQARAGAVGTSRTSLLAATVSEGEPAARHQSLEGNRRPGIKVWRGTGGPVSKSEGEPAARHQSLEGNRRPGIKVWRGTGGPVSRSEGEPAARCQGLKGNRRPGVKV
jgi:hypothetical protein